MTDTYAACAHGLPDGVPWLDCWSCVDGIGIGPNPPDLPPAHIRYAAEFVQQYRDLSGDRRFPLRAVPQPHEG